MKSSDHCFPGRHLGVVAGALAFLLLFGFRPLLAQANAVCLMCHADSSLMYSAQNPSKSWVTGDVLATSVHGRQGVECVSCHAGLEIPHQDSPPPVDCAECHAVQSRLYTMSAHGRRASDAGGTIAACSDCHGDHDVLPASESGSTLHSTNIVQTCGQCHVGATPHFARYVVHIGRSNAAKEPVIYWVFWCMAAVIFTVLLAVAFHSAAWLWRLAHTPALRRRHKPAEGEDAFRRFSPTDCVLHFGMVVCFFVLALTGMVLRFSDTGWATFVASVLGGLEMTSIVHKGAAVIYAGVFFVHLAELTRRKGMSGQSWLGFINAPDSLMFNRVDLKELRTSVLWFLGRGKQPTYGRFTYWEKFEYLAVVIGGLSMGVTGLVLSFPTFFAAKMPGWIVNVAGVIHSQEALLAVGLIFTVHLFNTQLRPGKFPVDPVILTGRLSLDELKAERPREYEGRVAQGTLRASFTKPLPRRWDRAMRTVTTLFVTAGLIFVVLIFWSVFS